MKLEKIKTNKNQVNESSNLDKEFDERFMKYSGKHMTPQEFHKMMKEIIDLHE